MSTNKILAQWCPNKMVRSNGTKKILLVLCQPSQIVLISVRLLTDNLLNNIIYKLLVYCYLMMIIDAMENRLNIPSDTIRHIIYIMERV